MNLIDKAVLTQLRKQAVTVFTQTCTIEHEVKTRGAAGQQLASWEVVAQNVPCRVIQLGQQTQNEVETVSSRESMSNEYRLTVSSSVALGVDHRVSIGTTIFHIIALETELTDEFFHSAIIAQRL